MSDTRFDGKRIYEFARATQAVFDIRGKYIHKANSASQPVYEIRGDYIHKAHSASQPEFEIGRDRIHKAHSATHRVILYLWPSAHGTKFDFIFRPRFRMNAQSAPSTLYDYYNPEARVVVAPARFVVD